MPYLGDPVDLSHVGRRHYLYGHPEDCFVDRCVGLQVLNLVVEIRVYNIGELDPLLPSNFEVESPPVFRATHCDCVAGEADLPLLLEFGLRVEVKKSVELLDQTVNLVDVENRPDPFLECLASHGLGLDHDLLDRVNDYYSPVDRSERSGYLSREINVPRGINEINDIGCSSMLVVEADICSLDRHLTLLFLFHEVHSERGPRE